MKAIIVENSGIKESYLDNLNCNILYTNNNKTERTHFKAPNELLDIKQVIK